MATTETHTVMPSGGDFTSLDAAIDHVVDSHHDLIGDDKIQAIKIDGTWSSADTTPCTIVTAHTDATRYLWIYTTASARHKGIWSTSYYMLNTSNVSPILLTSVSNVWFDGLQMGKSSEDAHYQDVCYLSGSLTATTNQILFSNCLTRGAANNSYRCSFLGAEAENQRIFVYNHIDYGHGTTNNLYNSGIWIGNGEVTVYCSTLIGGFSGINRAGGTAVTKGVYAAEFTAGGEAYGGVGASFTMTNCASSDTTAEDTNPYDSVACDTDTFVNVTYATADYHQAADGLSPLKEAGVDTSGDAAPMNFTTDIDGQTRT